MMQNPGAVIAMLFLIIYVSYLYGTTGYVSGFTFIAVLAAVSIVFLLPGMSQYTSLNVGTALNALRSNAGDNADDNAGDKNGSAEDFWRE